MDAKDYSLELIAVTVWSNSHIQGNLVLAQINNIQIFVRENVQYDSFSMSANTQIGLKERANA